MKVQISKFYKQELVLYPGFWKIKNILYSSLAFYFFLNA